MKKCIGRSKQDMFVVELRGEGGNVKNIRLIQGYVRK